MADQTDNRNYLASLPERSVRALAALGGGFVHETASVVLPTGVRRSRLYQATFGRLLRLIVELVGGVKGSFPDETLPVQDLMVRKAAGNAVEVAGFFAVGWSPIWLLAAVSDILGGTKVYLHALVDELKAIGALPQDASIATFEELLGALEGTSGTLADAIDVLPTSAHELRTAWEQLRARAAELPDAGRLAALFGELQAAAQHERRSLLQMSSLIALGAVRAGLQLGNTHLFGYYREALGTIAAEGLPAYLRRVSSPYLVGAVAHFDRRRGSLTERLLRRRRGSGDTVAG